MKSRISQSGFFCSFVHKHQDINSLDDIVNEESIALLKIDVEGYEYQVLRGGENTCKKTKLVYLECIPEMLERNGASEKDICEFLLRLGFKVYQVLDNQLIENVVGSHRKKMILARR